MWKFISNLYADVRGSYDKDNITSPPKPPRTEKHRKFKDSGLCETGKMRDTYSIPEDSLADRIAEVPRAMSPFAAVEPQGRRPRKPVIKPRVKMRPLFWSRILLDEGRNGYNYTESARIRTPLLVFEDSLFYIIRSIPLDLLLLSMFPKSVYAFR